MIPMTRNREMRACVVPFVLERESRWERKEKEDVLRFNIMSRDKKYSQTMKGKCTV